jgi:hypothetical protein
MVFDSAVLIKWPSKKEKTERGAPSPAKNLMILEPSSQREEDGEAVAAAGRTPSAKVKIDVAPLGGATSRKEEAAAPSPPRAPSPAALERVVAIEETLAADAFTVEGAPTPDLAPVVELVVTTPVVVVSRQMPWVGLSYGDDGRWRIWGGRMR